MHLNVEVEPNAGRIWFKKPPLVCFMLTSAYFCKWISRYFTPPPNNIYFSSARAFKLRFFFPSATRKLHGQRNWCGEQLSAPCKRYEGLCLLHALIIVAFWTTFALLKKTPNKTNFFVFREVIHKMNMLLQVSMFTQFKNTSYMEKVTPLNLDVLKGRPGL